mgnify:CR=1 FL=1
MESQNDLEKLASGIAERLKQSFEEVMDIDMLCAFIHLDKPTVYALTSQRRIPYSKPTGKLLFLKSKIVKWLEENHMPTQDEIKSNIQYTGRKKK